MVAVTITAAWPSPAGRVCVQALGLCKLAAHHRGELHQPLRDPVLNPALPADGARGRRLQDRLCAVAQASIMAVTPPTAGRIHDLVIGMTTCVLAGMGLAMMPVMTGSLAALRRACRRRHALPGRHANRERGRPRARLRPRTGRQDPQSMVGTRSSPSATATKLADDDTLRDVRDAAHEHHAAMTR